MRGAVYEQRMSTLDQAKRMAARAALSELPDAGIVGLGTGSTARLFIEEVALLVKSGRKLVGVPTSDASRAQALGLGIPLLEDLGPWAIEVCVDGADEVSDGLDLIKGGGGAHTREKIVNAAAKRNVIIVDGGKRSRQLGEKWPVPVEVLPFGRLATAALLTALGTPVLRERDGAPFHTDSGNFLYDLQVGPIAHPRALEARLRAIPGVVEVGLFVGRADVVFVARESGVERLTRR
jgi:ribose 5-phosphate isomerase A